MSVQSGISIFPLTLLTAPTPGFNMIDEINQVLEIIAQQVVSNTPLVNGGTFTANSTTAVVVPAANVTANSQVLITLKTAAGTPAAQPYLSAITPGTGFSVKAGSGDTSVYNYTVIG